MKLLTLEDYQKAGETFWPKYWYVSKELGENAKAEHHQSSGSDRYSCIAIEDRRKGRTIRIQ